MVIAPHHRARTGGITLLELMAVLVVVAVVTVLALPAMQGMIGSTNLQGSATTVLAQLDFARQTAGARNLPVQVRLYQDMTKPPDGNGIFPYRLLALVIPAAASSAGSDVFLQAPQGLPGNVIVDSSTTYSSLLNPSLGAVGLRPLAATERASAPLAVRNLPYIEFTFLANGTINLDATQKWCLTLINENDAPRNSASTPAANFVTLMVDPQTIHARMYQP